MGIKLSLTMLIQCVAPFFNLLISTVTLWLGIFADRGCSGDPFKTKKTTMQKYKNVYSGSEQPIHFKYSTSLNITYVALMYGLAMPVMWPLAALAFLNQRICERMQVAWLVMLPPATNDQITRQVVGILRFSPLFLLFNGYWLMDSKQLFDNGWTY